MHLWMKVKVSQCCLTLCHPMDYTWILQARILEWVAFPFSKGSSQPRDWTQVSNIAGGFFTSWVTGKAKNTGVDSWSLLQQIFPTQESNQGLLHCRQILYQLSYQRRRGDRGWDGQRASLTQWTWIWANSGRQWRTGKPGKLQVHGVAKCDMI